MGKSVLHLYVENEIIELGKAKGLNLSAFFTKKLKEYCEIVELNTSELEQKLNVLEETKKEFIKQKETIEQKRSEEQQQKDAEINEHKEAVKKKITAIYLNLQKCEELLQAQPNDKVLLGEKKRLKEILAELK